MIFYYFLLYNNYVKIRVPFTNNNCVVYTNVLSQKYYFSTIVVTLGRRYLSILGLFKHRLLTFSRSTCRYTTKQMRAIWFDNSYKINNYTTLLSAISDKCTSRRTWVWLKCIWHSFETKYREDMWKHSCNIRDRNCGIDNHEKPQANSTIYEEKFLFLLNKNDIKLIYLYIYLK